MSQVHSEPESETDPTRLSQTQQSRSDQDPQRPPGIVPEDPMNTDE